MRTMKRLLVILLVCAAVLGGTPLRAFALTPYPRLEGSAAILLDMTTGEVLYEMSFHLRSNYHHGVYTYKVEYEEGYIKLVFINENNVICQVYRFYYDDLDELAKLKDNNY